jgi:hypothetical protein
MSCRYTHNEGEGSSANEGDATGKQNKFLSRKNTGGKRQNVVA